MKFLKYSALAALLPLALVATLAFAGATEAAGTAVPLGTAGSFVVLAGAGITNTGPTTLNGDIGTYPTLTETGTASLTITGTNHAGDAVTQQAKSDLITAYNSAAGQGPTTSVPADLGGQTLTPGVYNSASALGLTGNLTLNAGGDPNAVFVFQAGSTLTTASGSSVSLINGAQACNVYWQVGSSATLGTASQFRGTVLALTSITLTTGATVEGRVLARNGSVTLDTNTITASTCSTPVATTSAGTTSATTTTKTTTTTPKTTTTTPTPVSASKAAKAKVVAAKKAAAKKAAAAKAHRTTGKATSTATSTSTSISRGHARPPVHHVAFTG